MAYNREYLQILIYLYKIFNRQNPLSSKKQLDPKFLPKFLQKFKTFYFLTIILLPCAKTSGYQSNQQKFSA